MRHFIFIFIPILLILFFDCSTLGKDTAYNIEIIDFGKYSKDNVAFEDAEGTVIGKVRRTTNVTLLEKTDRIPGELGVSFGIRYIINVKNNRKMIPLNIKIKHPPFTNPDNNKTSDCESWTRERTVGEPLYDGYTFDCEWEIVKGNWLFEIWCYNNKLIEKEFSIY